MSNKFKTIGPHGLVPAWRLVWWDYRGHAGWMRPKGSRLKKFIQPQAQSLDFYTEALARQHIASLKRELGDNVVVKLRELAR
jgi:hypothetical protein